MKSIIIIGSGLGGLAAGIYGRRNGFETTIYESHSLPGGQFTSWKRNGYTFDAALHFFGGGGSRRTRFNRFWEEIGAFPCEMVKSNEVVSAYDEDGTVFHDLYNLVNLQSHMIQVSPDDSDVIKEYTKDIRRVMKYDKDGALFLGPWSEKFSSLPGMILMMKYFSTTLETYAQKFKHPLFRKAFPLLHYSCQNVPVYMHLVKHSDVAKGGSGLPAGGGMALIKNMVSLYEQLGGAIHYKQKVVKILTQNGCACGVELENGEQRGADFVISNADGRKTILQMLEGHYVNKKIVEYCKPNPDTVLPYPVAVYLGVKQELSSHPSTVLLFLKSPVVIAGHSCEHLGMQIFCCNSGMAPVGKSVIRVELSGRASYFENLSKDPVAYKAEKEKVAGQVVDLLEKKFPGLRNDIEVIDVTTLKTWERFMGGTQGFHNIPNMKFNIMEFIFNSKKRFTLPGLKNFYFAGQWATAAEVGLSNAVSGKTVIREICRLCGKKFKAGSEKKQCT